MPTAKKEPWELTRQQYFRQIARKDWLKPRNSEDPYWPVWKLQGLGDKPFMWQMAWDTAALDEQIGHFHKIKRKILSVADALVSAGYVQREPTALPGFEGFAAFSGPVATYLRVENFIEYEALWIKTFLENPQMLTFWSTNYVVLKPWVPNIVTNG